MQKATISDVAQLAGVSIKSVSRVVNNEANVRPTMRAKVQKAIEALDYKPNLAARSLAAGRSFIIGILFDNPSPNYTMKFQEGAYDACRRNGYQLMIAHIATAGQDPASAMKQMLANRAIDGMIVTPPATDSPAVLDALEHYRIDYVRVAPKDFPERSPAVSVNDSGAIEEMVQYLWGLGHRRFGFIDGPASHGASKWRRDGFFEALAQRGVKSDHVRVAGGDFAFTSGIGAGMQLLRGHDRPTAIFAANDDMAAGLFSAAGQMNIKIPDMLSVVGFDDSWIAKSVWPELTTLHQPIAEMADAAVELLISRKTGRAVNMPRQQCRFVVRGSTGPAFI